MRLLIAVDIFPPESGGPATYAVTLANELAKQNDDIVIISLNPKSDKNILDKKVKLYSVNSNFKPLRYWQYHSLLKKYGKDVDVIYAMGPVNAGWPALRAARKLGKKFVVKVVGDYAWEQGQVIGKVKDSIDDFQKKKYGGKIGLLQKIERQVVCAADMVIAPSVYLKKIVMGWGVSEDKVEVIYNAVEFRSVVSQLFHPKESWIVLVNRLVPWKGVNVLIEIMPEILKVFPEIKLKIIGDGPEFDRFNLLIKRLNLHHSVEMLGNLPHEKTLSYIKSADIFVLNSSYEGLSHVLLEALNAGTPVLVSNVGGNPELVKKENLFEPNNKMELIEKISTQLKNTKINSDTDSTISAWIGSEAFYKQFRLKEMISKTKDLLEKFSNK